MTATTMTRTELLTPTAQNLLQVAHHQLVEAARERREMTAELPALLSRADLVVNRARLLLVETTATAASERRL